MNARIKIPVLIVSLAILHGCTAVQDVKPDVSDAKQDIAKAQAEETAKPVSNHDITREWWLLFKSPQISEHINRAFMANPNTEAALAIMRRAQEHPVIRQGFFYPRVGAAKLSLLGMPGQSSGGQTDYSLHIAQLTVGYVPEVFGAMRGSSESTRNQAEAQQLAAYFTLSSNVVAAALQESSLRAQIEAQLYIIGLNRQALEIVHNQFKLGYVTEKEVTQRELDAAQAQQALVPLQQQFDRTRELMRMLAGNLPDPDADAEDAFRLEDLHLSMELPLSLPSRLVEHRPDVRIAEARLRSAGAKYGAEVANTLPRFTISAAAGGAAASNAWMLRDGGRFFDMNGNIAQIIFGQNTLRSKSHSEQQALNRAATQYRGVVMTALQDVADTLGVIQTDTRVLDAASQVAQLAGEAGELMRKRYEAGFVDFPTMRAAQQNEQIAIIGLAQARANRMGDSVALFQALGGHWWKQDDADKAKAKQP